MTDDVHDQRLMRAGGSDDHHATISDGSEADQGVRRVRNRLIVALFLTAFALMVGWAVVHPVLDRMQREERLLLAAAAAELHVAEMLVETLTLRELTPEDPGWEKSRGNLFTANERLRRELPEFETLIAGADQRARMYRVLDLVDGMMLDRPEPADVHQQTEMLLAELQPGVLGLLKEVNRESLRITEATKLQVDWTLRIVMAAQLLALTGVTLLCFRPSIRQVRQIMDRLGRDSSRLLIARRTADADRRRLQAVLDVAVAGIVVTNHRGEIELFNPAAERMFGYPASDMLGKSVSLLLPARERGRHQDLIQGYLDGRETTILGRGREVVGERRSGEAFPLFISVDLIRSTAEPSFVAVMLDLADQKAVQQRLLDSEGRLRDAEQIAKLGHFDLDPVSGRMTGSPTFHTILGFDRKSSVEEVEFRSRLESDDQERWKSLLDDLSWNHTVLEFHLRPRKGADPDEAGDRQIRVTVQRRNRPDLPPTLFGIVQDVSDQRAMEQELRSLSTTDPLTQIANRRYLEHLADQEMERARRYRRSMAVVLVALDDFSKINMNHGHAVGDRVLIASADTLRSGLRGVDHIGRIGGSKFCIILPETEADGTRIVADRLRDAVRSTTIRGEMSTFHVTASVAFVCRNGDEEQFSKVLSRAEQVLDEAISAGGDRVAEG